MSGTTSVHSPVGYSIMDVLARQESGNLKANKWDSYGQYLEEKGITDPKQPIQVDIQSLDNIYGMRLDEVGTNGNISMTFGEAIELVVNAINTRLEKSNTFNERAVALPRNVFYEEATMKKLDALVGITVTDSFETQSWLAIIMQMFQSEGHIFEVLEKDSSYLLRV